MGKGCCGQNGPRQGSNGSQNSNGKRCVTGSHQENICHGTNERRRDLMDQLKIFLDEFDDRPCPSAPPQSATGGLKPLGEYPEYLRKHCQSWMPDPPPPNITSNGTHEVRLTSDYERAKKEQSENVSYVDARAKKPIPPSCDCAKRNGLQDQCSRPECTPPTPQCLATNPGPCCPPSLGMTGQEAAEKAQRGRTQGARRVSPQTTYQQDFQYQPENQNMGGKSAYASVYKQDYCPSGGNTPPGPSPWQMQGQDCNRSQPKGCEPQDQGRREVVAVGVYKTVYNKDYGTPSGPGSPTFTSSPQAGQKMMCFCPLPPSAMPPGKKYLCCPLPE